MGNAFGEGLKAVDFYGDQIRGQSAWYARTRMGGCVTIVVYSGVFALVASNFATLLKRQTIATAGERVVYNHEKQQSTEPQLDYPSLYVQQYTSLSFYNKEFSSLQRIDINDNLGIHERSVSSNDSVPITHAVYQKLKVPLGTFDPNTSPVLPKSSLSRTDIKGILEEQAPQQVGPETIKAFYVKANVFEEVDTFYPHEAVLYMRFRPDQLSRLKKCQLQVSFTNEAEREVLHQYQMLNERSYQSETFMPNFVTANETWNPLSFTNDGAYNLERNGRTPNLIRLSQTISQQEANNFITRSKSRTDFPRPFSASEYNIEPRDFLNWRFGISYVNNMLLSFGEDTCGDTGEAVKFPTGNSAIYVNVFDNKTKTMTFQDNDKALKLFKNYRQRAENPVDFPFDVVVTGLAGTERVRVIKPIYSRPCCEDKSCVCSSSDLVGVKIERDTANGAVDFTATATSTLPSSPPSEWTCPMQAYYDGKMCDCECGAYDPDCDTASIRVRGCPREKRYCSKRGKCSAQSVTSTTLAQISNPCSSIWLEGQTTLVGYTGTEQYFNQNFETLTDANDLCMACPGDLLYEGIPQKGEDNRYYCNFKATGLIDSRVLTRKGGADGEVQFGDSIWMVPVVLNSKTAFPVKDLQADSSITVKGSGGNGPGGADKPFTPPTYDVNAIPSSYGRPSGDNGKGHLGQKQEMLWKAKGKSDYYVRLSVGTGAEEQAEVIGADPKNEDTGMQTLYLKFDSASSTRTHFGQGQLIGAVGKGIKHIYIIPKQIDISPPVAGGIQIGGAAPRKPTYFPESGPYMININTIPCKIRSGATVEGTFPDGTDMTIQALEIDSLPEASAGTITDLAASVTAGTSTVDVEVGASKFKSMGPVKGPGGGPPTAGGSSASAPSKFSDMTIPSSLKVPVIIEGTYGSQGSEMLYLDSAVTHPDFAAWTGSAGDYNLGDKICDCNRGMYDPDCAAPTPMRFFLNSLTDTRFKIKGCAAGQMCSLSGTCISSSNGKAVPSQGPNKIAEANAFVATAGNENYDKPPAPKPWKERLTFRSPLTMDHMNGVKVHSPFTSTLTKNVDVYYQAEVELVRDTGYEPYSPKQRYRRTREEPFESPRLLDVEISMFTVPKRNDLDKTKICPDQVRLPATVETDATWQARSGADIHVNCDRLGNGGRPKKKTVKQGEACVFTHALEKNVYNKRCLAEMPETYEFSVDVEIPLNDKWDLAKIKAGTPDADWTTSVQKLENRLEWDTTFYFSHDRSVEQVNRKFSEGVESGGDVDQNGNLWKFFGAMDYRGEGKPESDIALCRSQCESGQTLTGKCSKVDCASIALSYLAPASTPYLSTYLQVLANVSSSQKMLKSIAAESWPSGKAAQLALLESFNTEPLEITFDMDTVGGYTSRKMIPLEPGYVYTLSADVAIEPIYRESVDFFNNIMGSYVYTLIGWKKSVVSTSITRTESSYFARQRTSIRYVITFRDDVNQIRLKLVFGVVQFMVALGAAAGYLGFGTLILDNWQMVFPHPDEEHDSGYHATDKRSKSKGDLSIKKSSPKTAAVMDKGEVELPSLGRSHGVSVVAERDV